MPGVERTVSHPENINSVVAKIREIAALNVDRFIETQLQVVDKNGNAKPFIYRWPQRRVAQIIKQEEAKRLPLRLYILKSRQVGLSTMIAARFFVKTWALDNREALVFAQQEKRAEELLARCKFFYASLPYELRLSLAQDSRLGLKYADTRGNINVVSAKAMDVVRGGTKQYIQLSEWAHCRNPLALLNEIEQPVDYEEGTEIIIETTGKGFGSDAHEFWKACESEKENYRAIFLPWQEDPNCSIAFASERDRDTKLAEAFEYEPRLQDRYKNKMFGLTAGNLYYAYRILRNKCHGDYEFFLQEYPCTPDEAWRATGQSYFGTENLNNIRVGEWKFEYKTFGVNCPIGKEFTCFEDLDTVTKLNENESRPFIKVWGRPRPNAEYVMASDSAEGEEDGNFSSTFVVDKHTLEMMAEFHGRIRPDEHAMVIFSLGTIYNNALAAPEYNTPGNVTLHELKRLCYDPIYRWRYTDDVKNRLTNKFGWQTNASSRPMMLSLAKRIVADMAAGRVLSKGIIKSQSLLDEMKTFVVADDGRAEAGANCQDDRVMAWSIAVVVSAQETYGSKQDILSLYKTQPEEPTAQLVSAADYEPTDPKDVISRLAMNPSQPLQYEGMINE